MATRILKGEEAVNYFFVKILLRPIIISPHRRPRLMRGRRGKRRFMAGSDFDFLFFFILKHIYGFFFFYTTIGFIKASDLFSSNLSQPGALL